MNPASTERNKNFLGAKSGSTSGSRWFKPVLLKIKRQAQSCYQSYRCQVSPLDLFSFSCFLFQSLLLRSPPLSLNSIMNCIQSVVLQPRGLYFHIDGFWEAGKLDATVLIFFFLWQYCGQRIKSRGPKETSDLKPCRHICQSLVMNYVQRQQTTIMEAAGGGGEFDMQVWKHNTDTSSILH